MPASGIVVSRPVVQASDCFGRQGLRFRFRQRGWAGGVTTPARFPLVPMLQVPHDTWESAMPGSTLKRFQARVQSTGRDIFTTQLQEPFVLDTI